MDVFNATWLVERLGHCSQSPRGRILGLFEVLSDCLSAPDAMQNAIFTASATEALTAHRIASSPLVDYLTTQTQALGASHPKMLAEHIALIACNAAQQQMLNPTSKSLMHAKKAAEALILSQMPRNKFTRTPAIAASLTAAVLSVTIALAWFGPLPLTAFNLSQFNPGSHKSAETIAMNTHSGISNAQSQRRERDQTDYQVTPTHNALTASDAAMMYAKYEQMRTGTCQYLEVLQIPDQHKTIYLENVVGGQLPTNLQDLAIANQYLEKIRCNFTPMLMANSK